MDQKMPMTKPDHRPEPPLERDGLAGRLAILVVCLVGAVIGGGLLFVGNEWVSNGDHGQAGWALRIGGIALIGGCIALTRWRPRRVRWAPIVLVAACIGLLAFGARLHSLAGSEHEPVYQDNGAWFTHSGEVAMSPGEHDALSVGSWLLILGGVAGLGALLVVELRRKPVG